LSSIQLVTRTPGKGAGHGGDNYTDAEMSTAGAGVENESYCQLIAEVPHAHNARRKQGAEKAGKPDEGEEPRGCWGRVLGEAAARRWRSA